ncbi:hypothetical protein B0H16DRAFT_1472585 [Mycena metata]|uniref:Uncharacterized protein n=1 Tax=Mycena metata TaxID=1033252 RepID=A0AAD7HM97_9AGAR|nr:hypothetical protein B0H16DRAFT_1472585 [Mycena metata]
MSSATKRSVVVVVEIEKSWLIINVSRAESPIFPTTSNGELTTDGELTTNTAKLTHAERQAQKEAEEDLLLANNYFERIGRRQRIHEYAVYHHLKHTSKSTLRLVVETFNDLYASEMQVPPPLRPADDKLDAKAAIARGRALAFTEGTPEAERAWAYGFTYTNGEAAEHYDAQAVETEWADRITNQVLATPQDGRRVHDDNVFPRSSGSTAPSLEEAKLAVERIKNIALRLRPKQECRQSGEDTQSATKEK